MTLSRVLDWIDSSQIDGGPTKIGALVIEMLHAAFGNSVKRLYRKSNPFVQQILSRHFARVSGTLTLAACRG